MTQTRLFSMIAASAVLALCAISATSPAHAGPPSVLHADADYDASGYVTPAGMAPPTMYYGSVMPVGYHGGGCDSCGSGCDGLSCGAIDPCTINGCDASCGGRCGILAGGSMLGKGHFLGRGGLLGKMRHAGLRPLCLFCQGSGCSACEMFAQQQLMALLYALRPYSEGGLCAQRWYDLSAEALFLSHSNGGVGGPITSQDPLNPSGTIVLGLGDSDSGGDTEAGVRLSGSMIFGAGGNVEATYMGGHQWGSEAVARSNPANTPTLFSFISDFGANPPGGFDDTDRSILQAVTSRSKFHSGELNYRRRTMGPYCRFQGSWLVGLRYLRFDNGLLYSTLGQNDNTVNANLPRFFSSDDFIKNNLFGGQAGFDLWWNMVPGVNMGIGMKGAWMQNDAKRTTTLTANSINVGAPGIINFSDTERQGTVMGEFETKIVYRLSHSWTFRSAYYAIAVDDIAFGIADRQTIRDFVTANPITEPRNQFHSLVVQGFSFGAEYMW